MVHQDALNALKDFICSQQLKHAWQHALQDNMQIVWAQAAYRANKIA